ncbi:hypothetical protein [Celeribacter sp.]|uniref:hypothetical protein n=1 Tax=Celeribacter sp. TaxID=1890673 RepID=UPI003A8D75BD
MMHDGNVEPKRDEVGGIDALRLELVKRRARGEPYVEVLRGFLPPQMLADRDSLDCAIVEMAFIDQDAAKAMKRFVNTFSPEFERMALEAI